MGRCLDPHPAQTGSLQVCWDDALEGPLGHLLDPCLRALAIGENKGLAHLITHENETSHMLGGAWARGNSIRVSWTLCRLLAVLEARGSQQLRGSCKPLFCSAGAFEKVKLGGLLTSGTELPPFCLSLVQRACETKRAANLLLKASTALTGSHSPAIASFACLWLACPSLPVRLPQSKAALTVAFSTRASANAFANLEAIWLLVK